jgi:hypothetical protein
LSESAVSYQPPPNGWRTFLIIWGTQLASVFGSAMTLFAMNLWLTQTLYPRPDQKPQLAAALAAINLAFAIPVVFGAPIAGGLGRPSRPQAHHMIWPRALQVRRDGGGRWTMMVYRQWSMVHRKGVP